MPSAPPKVKDVCPTIRLNLTRPGGDNFTPAGRLRFGCIQPADVDEVRLSLGQPTLPPAKGGDQ
jgi:hypothetical protein